VVKGERAARRTGLEDLRQPPYTPVDLPLSRLILICNRFTLLKNAVLASCRAKCKGVT